MDSSFRGEQGSGRQETSKSFLAGRKILASLLHWLADLFKLTEEEREDAGIYFGRQGDE